jgi:hypothetical protein
LRRLTADVIQFQGIVRAGQQRADRENNHLAMQLVIQTMDQAWKPLAHQIGTTRGSSSTLRQTAEKISQSDAQACQILGIRDQFNMRELVRAADVLSADLRTLTDELSYERFVISGPESTSGQTSEASGSGDIVCESCCWWRAVSDCCC